MPTTVAMHEPIRPLLRLLCLEMEWRFRRGDKMGAVRSAIDGLRLGIAIPRGAFYSPFLAGAAMETISRRWLLRHVKCLDASSVRFAIQELAKLSSRRVSLADALRVDMRMGIASLPALIQHSDEENETELKPHTRQIIKNYSDWMSEIIKGLSRRYMRRPPLIIPSDPLCQSILPIYLRAGCNEARNIAGHDLLSLTLALRLYYLEHRAYPAALKSLVPKYLMKIPIDVFGEDELRFQRTAKGYKLYSCGPDGIDNKGTPIPGSIEFELEAVEPPLAYAVQPTSKGDFVAGVNF